MLYVVKVTLVRGNRNLRDVWCRNTKTLVLFSKQNTKQLLKLNVCSGKFLSHWLGTTSPYFYNHHSVTNSQKNIWAIYESLFNADMIVSKKLHFVNSCKSCLININSVHWLRSFKVDNLATRERYYHMPLIFLYSLKV